MKSKILIAMVLAAGITACGSSGNSNSSLINPPVPADANMVPSSATASVASYVSYLGALAVSDSVEPLNTDAAIPPTTDIDEPLAL